MPRTTHWDPGQLSVWVKHRSSLCEGCWAACCTLPVEVSAFDLLRLELITEDEAAGSLKKLSRRLIREGSVRSYNSKAQLFILEQKNGRDCVFLGTDRLCTVYKKRPEVCRAFPKIGPKPGFCPAKAR